VLRDDASIMTMIATVITEVVTFPRDAVLTIEQVAVGLQLAVSRVEKMGIKTIYCGKQKRRYLWGQVLDQLAERAQ
jgi:hypothetical protein